MNDNAQLRVYYFMLAALSISGVFIYFMPDVDPVWGSITEIMKTKGMVGIGMSLAMVSVLLIIFNPNLSKNRLIALVTGVCGGSAVLVMFVIFGSSNILLISGLFFLVVIPAIQASNIFCISLIRRQVKAIKAKKKP